jgi:hypothetical protein
MRCIFCKQSSTSSRSEEHICPESLGNKEHVLPPGWVCDQCNNYLARKVEAPFLNSQYGRYARFGMGIPSKRGRLPPVSGIHAKSLSEVELRISKGGSPKISSISKKDMKRLDHSMVSSTSHTVYVLPPNVPQLDYRLSRFIGKIAIEALALTCIDVPKSNAELVENQGLDELRNYVRRGRPGFVWPVNIRQLYPSNWAFSDGTSPLYEVLHEWKILPIPAKSKKGLFEFYAVIAIFGVEYTINCGGPVLDSYQQWLADNNNASPLYMEQT